MTGDLVDCVQTACICRGESGKGEGLILLMVVLKRGGTYFANGSVEKGRNLFC